MDYIPDYIKYNIDYIIDERSTRLNFILFYSQT